MSNRKPPSDDYLVEMLKKILVQPTLKQKEKLEFSQHISDKAYLEKSWQADQRTVEQYVPTTEFRMLGSLLTTPDRSKESVKSIRMIKPSQSEKYGGLAWQRPEFLTVRHDPAIPDRVDVSVYKKNGIEHVFALTHSEFHRIERFIKKYGKETNGS